MFRFPAHRHQDKKLLHRIGNIIFAYSFIMSWIWMTYTLVNRWVPMQVDEPNHYFSLFMTVIWAPLWEEAVFRHAAIQLARKIDEAVIFPVCLISSAIFGLGHRFGAISILMQGVAGLALCWVYIKNGYSYISSVIVHFLWNFTVCMLGSSGFIR
jgi:membrane protease YdiL (CAAX protease family)